MKILQYERLTKAQGYSKNNKAMLDYDEKCGCFYCMRIFNPKEINELIDDKGGATAICPYCGIDAVIGESSGYPIRKEFLEEMYKQWF